ncbi:MAG: helix-turn-helix domain-containing protein [bacterium]|nr:helix-turn-helix domain-containing protein [bacterium]
MDRKPLSDILKEQLAANGLDAHRLSQLTGIQDRYLTGLIEGETQALPAAPYVRGYLIKIASHLELDGLELWNMFKEEQLIKSSGGTDALPSNRFAIKKTNKKVLVGIVLTVVVGAYLLWNVGHLIGRPELAILYPEAQTLISDQETVTIVGQIDPADKLMINFEEVPVNNSGAFEKEVELALGLNRIEFIVKRFLGRETQAIRQIIYQPN